MTRDHWFYLGILFLLMFLILYSRSVATDYSRYELFRHDWAGENK